MQKKQKKVRWKDAEQKGKSSLTLFLLASAPLCLVAAAAVWRLLGHSTLEDSRPGGVGFVQVPRQELGNQEYRAVAEKRLPVILDKTIAERWPAKDVFTTEFLSRKLGQVSAHRQEHKRSFITFHDDKALEPLVVEKWEEFNLKVNATIPEVLQWANPERSKQVGPYMYYSQDIATLTDQFPDILGYVQPIQPLILSQDNVQVNLWVGREGIVTHTHYDCTYNFFVQLQGRKRFTLFPPNHPLYLYPCLHPHYGHSQVDILEPSSHKYPNYSSDGGYVAEVGPGDMLVVPPFWFHHVETLEESVSINVWSDAPEYALINRIYALPVPFEEEWAWPDLLTATKLYIDMIIGSWNAETSSDGGARLPSGFLQDLLEQRYRPLVSAAAISVNQSLVEQLDRECQRIDWQKARERFENKLSGGVETLAALFKTFPSRATMEICLGNYMEHLVYSVLGLDYVYPFLSTCALVS